MNIDGATWQNYMTGRRGSPRASNTTYADEEMIRGCVESFFYLHAFPTSITVRMWRAAEMLEDASPAARLISGLRTAARSCKASPGSEGTFERGK